MSSEENVPETTTQEIGPWVVCFEWDMNVSRGNPSRVVIEPADDARWPDLLGGVSTTVLRQVSPVRPSADNAHTRRARELLAFAAERYSPSSAEYLAALSLMYTGLSDLYVPNPSAHLAETAGRSQNTVKAHLKAARKAGLLTATPHRVGGGITEKAGEALQRVILASNET